MSRPAQAFVMVMLGATLIRLTLTGAAVDYVRAGLSPYLIAAGIFLVVLGVVGVLRDLRGEQAAKDAARFDVEARVRTHGPGARESGQVAVAHDHHGWYGHGAGWLLCLPLFLLLVIPPPALGSYAAGRTDAKVPKPAGRPSYPALPMTSVAAVTIRDYAARAVWDQGRTLAERQVLLTGFVAPSVGGDPWYIARLHITCCAADAQTAKVAVDGAAGRFPAGQWIALTGTWEASDPHDLEGKVARVQAVRIRPIAPPAQPYE